MAYRITKYNQFEIGKLYNYYSHHGTKDFPEIFLCLGFQKSFDYNSNGPMDEIVFLNIRENKKFFYGFHDIRNWMFEEIITTSEKEETC
jgi:hypothetical protein